MTYQIIYNLQPKKKKKHLRFWNALPIYKVHSKLDNFDLVNHKLSYGTIVNQTGCLMYRNHSISKG